MKKNFILSVSLILICTSCTNYLTKLSDKILDYTAIIESKSSKFFNRDTQEPDNIISSAEFYGSSDDEFIPLKHGEINSKITTENIPQPSSTPGTKQSFLPSISSFKTPNQMLASIFKKIYFHTDQYQPKDAEGKKTLKQIANFLKKHPNIYVFIEGHCDARASESYNLALGSKRANNIRNTIIKYGSTPNQLYTISYGKEKPVAKGITRLAYAKNRRVSFKIYEKK